MVASVQQPWKFQLPTLAFLDGPVGVGVDDDDEVVVVVMAAVVMVAFPEIGVVVEVEETGTEVVVVRFAISSLYTLRRDGPPQYSVELSIQRQSSIPLGEFRI